MGDEHIDLQAVLEKLTDEQRAVIAALPRDLQETYIKAFLKTIKREAPLRDPFSRSATASPEKTSEPGTPSHKETFDLQAELERLSEEQRGVIATFPQDLQEIAVKALLRTIKQEALAGDRFSRSAAASPERTGEPGTPTFKETFDLHTELGKLTDEQRAVIANFPRDLQEIAVKALPRTIRREAPSGDRFSRSAAVPFERTIEPSTPTFKETFDLHAELGRLTDEQRAVIATFPPDLQEIAVKALPKTIRREAPSGDRLSRSAAAPFEKTSKPGIPPHKETFDLQAHMDKLTEEQRTVIATLPQDLQETAVKALPRTIKREVSSGDRFFQPATAPREKISEPGVPPHKETFDLQAHMDKLTEEQRTLIAAFPQDLQETAVKAVLKTIEQQAPSGDRFSPSAAVSPEKTSEPGISTATIAFNFDPRKQLIIDFDRYEGLLVRLAQLEAERKQLQDKVKLIEDKRPWWRR